MAAGPLGQLVSIQLVLVIVGLCLLHTGHTRDILILYAEDVGRPENNWGFERTGSAMPMAIEDFQNQGWLKEFNFKFIHIPESCSPKIGIANVAAAYYKYDPDIVVGFGCSFVLVELGLYTAYWNRPLFPQGGTDYVLGDKVKYRGLVRIHSSGEKIAGGFKDIFQAMGWTKVALIYAYGFCELTGPAVRTNLEESGVEITEEIITAAEGTEDYRLREYLLRIKERARVIVYCLRSTTRISFLEQAYELGLYPGYVFITWGGAGASLYSPWTLIVNVTQQQEELWRHMLIKLNYKGVSVAVPEGDAIDRFLRDVPVKLAGPPFYFNLTLELGLIGSSKAVDMYDLLLTYLTVINETVAEGKGPEYFRNGSYVQDKIRNRKVIGMSGKFAYDENADRIPNLWLWSMRPEQETLEAVAIIKMAENLGERFEYLGDKRAYWDTEDGEPPRDAPVCGFYGELCVESADITGMVVGLVIGLVIISVAIGVLAYLYKRKQDEDAMKQMLWKVNYEDIIVGKKRTGSVAAISSKAINRSTNSRLSDGLQDEEENARVAQMFTETGTYKGILVALLRSNNRNLNLTHRDLVELNAMRDMNHDNIVAFVGACIDPPDICYLMMYCQKGSLQGLSYIHKSELGSHGGLKSTCCLVDSRWQLKISSYGLHAFRQEHTADIGEYERYRKMLWTAPEILRLTKKKPRYGSKKADIFSLGIITHEIIYRTMPFGMLETSTPQEVVQKVMSNRTVPFRPTLGKLEEDVHEDVKDLMRKCWEEEPEKRPLCDMISKYLLKMNEGQKIDIMGTIINKLEKYANNLEEIVNQRTAELVNEKRKTDSLLYKMLPESVANSLKQGKVVEAELYEQVTVYFSDIVGFTQLSLASSPIQVVDLLNDLYTMFDDMIEQHDVYKVETISDSYMVVSGLPKRNGNKHVGEIANLALSLMSAAVTRFKIRHRPDMTLQLRIGFHTGPCAAGVVGLAMPRYCLFGDTVNMASRMETNGKALRIHMSKFAYASLSALGNYEIVPRGEMPIKGKGMQMTYWLVGRKGFDQPLPNFDE